MPVDTQTAYDGIIIRQRSEQQEPMWPAIVNEALATIASQPVGRSLLTQIASMSDKKKFGYTVCIMRPAGLGIEDKNDGKGPQWNCGSVAKRGNEDDACDGTGSITAVTWNANIIQTPDGSRPSFIALAHELVHALYNLKGEAYKDASAEEYRTVGLPPVENHRDVTENKIRAEHGIPRRAAYGGLAPPAI